MRRQGVASDGRKARSILLVAMAAMAPTVSVFAIDQKAPSDFTRSSTRAPALATEPERGVTLFRLSPSDGWAPGRRPPRQPLLDVPTHLLGSPPEAVADLYWKALSVGDDGRLVAGTVPLRLTATEIGGEAGQDWRAQLTLLGNAWPQGLLPLGRAYIETSPDPELRLFRSRNASDPQVVMYHTDPDAPDFVWIHCAFVDPVHVGPQGDGTCWMRISAVPNVATSVGFPATELPLWRLRANYLRVMTLAWARSPDEWPAAEVTGEVTQLDGT